MLQDLPRKKDDGTLHQKKIWEQDKIAQGTVRIAEMAWKTCAMAMVFFWNEVHAEICEIYSFKLHELILFLFVHVLFYPLKQWYAMMLPQLLLLWTSGISKIQKELQNFKHFWLCQARHRAQSNTDDCLGNPSKETRTPAGRYTPLHTHVRNIGRRIF